MQNSQDMIEILQIVHKAFYPLFNYYTKENEGLMTIKNFMKFTKDFEIFPYLIGKAKLNSFFNGISQYSMYGQKDITYIEHSLFVDLIALMALEMNYPDPEPSPVEKILIFIEKLSQSQGPGKIVLNTGSNKLGYCGNFLEYFKEAYPGYFNIEKSVEEGFSSIMQNDEENENNNGEENEEENIQINENNIKENNINNINNNNIDKEVQDDEINNNEINDNNNEINDNNNEINENEKNNELKEMNSNDNNNINDNN